MSGIALLTLIINGVTMRPLLQSLGMAGTPSKAEEEMFEHAILVIEQKVQAEWHTPAHFTFTPSTPRIAPHSFIILSKKSSDHTAFSVMQIFRWCGATSLCIPMISTSAVWSRSVISSYLCKRKTRSVAKHVDPYTNV